MAFIRLGSGYARVSVHPGAYDYRMDQQLFYMPAQKIVNVASVPQRSPFRYLRSGRQDVARTAHRPAGWPLRAVQQARYEALEVSTHTVRSYLYRDM